MSLDNVYWVRKEASYALGALAKVVPTEIVIMTLVRTLPATTIIIQAVPELIFRFLVDRYRYSSRCVQTRCGTSATLRSLRSLRSFPA